MIVDFGFAKQLPDLKKGLKNCSEKRGTQYFKSPEMYFEKGEISGIDADIFSLGTVLMSSASKRVYFYLENLNKNDAKHIEDKNYPECLKICSMKMKAVRNSIMNNKKYSPELKNLYLRMISIEPNERPSLEEVLKDPLLKEINEIESDEKKFAMFKEEYKNYMIEIINKSNKSSEVNTKENKKDEDDENETRSMPSENIKEYFEPKKKPKKLINQKFNYKYFMKLKG